MDRRRALLGGGKKILYVYKPGFTSWQNINQSTTDGTISTSFGSDSVTLTGRDTYNTLNLRIPESIYGKYEKLVFKAKSSKNDSNLKICWSKTANYTGDSNGSTVSRITTTVQEFSVDISNDSGKRFIVMSVYYSGTVFTIYDIHFE